MSNVETLVLTMDSPYIAQIAPLYSASFGEGQKESEGWGERAACYQTNCLEDGKRKIVPYKDVGTPCPECATPMEEAYPLDWTIQYIVKELSKPNPIGFLGFINSELAGAAWGYVDNLDVILDDKYHTQIMRNKINKRVKSRWPRAKKSKYISEVVVAPWFRKKFVATTLVQSIIDYNYDPELPVTMRTMRESSMFGIGGFVGLEQIIGPNLGADSIDTEEERRVFFVSPKR